MKKTEILKERVLFLLDAINVEDYKSARECLHNDFEYREFLFTYNGADGFINKMKTSRMKFSIQKVFADEQNVCVFYNIEVNSENEIFGCGLYGFENDRLKFLYLLSNHVPAQIPSLDGHGE